MGGVWLEVGVGRRVWSCGMVGWESGKEVGDGLVSSCNLLSLLLLLLNGSELSKSCLRQLLVPLWEFIPFLGSIGCFSVSFFGAEFFSCT